MNNPLFKNTDKKFAYSLSALVFSLFIFLAGDTAMGFAATRSGEVVSSGSSQVSSDTLTHFGIIGQASPVGVSTVAGGEKMISGKLISGSGLGAYSELDSDIDGTPDAEDAFPEDPNEDTDTDHDRIGNNADTDDDNDGVSDSDDAFPLDPNETVDTDGDGTGDNGDAFPDDPGEDTDSDGDGVGDNADVFPQDQGETLDSDSDGTGDNADTDDDNDGIADSVEINHPNGGDGNKDGIPDNLQAHVVSILSSNGHDYITLESLSGTRLSDCLVRDALPDTPMHPTRPNVQINFEYGFVEFTIQDLAPDGSASLVLYFPDDARLDTYYKYGPTPDDQTDHWYEFIYDEETGAVIDNENKTITLHFKDAQRGDSNPETDGIIIDPGGAGTYPRGDGGCFIDVLF